jgi:D-proline reductase (dithiol) PrdB
VSLAARYLEENGISTVVVAAARDIVETCGVARLLFTDFPLGSPCGEPENVAMQREIVGRALDLLESATESRTTVQSPFEWHAGSDWKAKIFTQEQPWKDEEETNEWLARKELYRNLKQEGKV